jgi:hypothetical protein
MVMDIQRDKGGKGGQKKGVSGTFQNTPHCHAIFDAGFNLWCMFEIIPLNIIESLYPDQHWG